MDGIQEQLFLSGCYEKVNTIIELYSPSKDRETKFKTHHFAVVAYPCFGSMEGSYVEVIATGDFEPETPKFIHLGSYRSHCSDLDSIRRLGAFAGEICYFARKFMNEHIDQFYERE